MLGFIAGMFIGGVLIILVTAYCSKQECPKLIGSENPKDNSPMKTYTIEDNFGNRQYIMTTKSLDELITELDHLSE